MASQEHVERLKRSIVEWNTWRQENPKIWPNLINADLGHTNLINADLSRTDLEGANLSRANLSHIDFNRTSLEGANLRFANLSHANLSRANLSYIHLQHTDLSHANLSRTNLSYTTLDGAKLDGAYLNQTVLFHTTFAWVDLSKAKELETANHKGPSIVHINSVILPHDEPTRFHFLRGVGFTETQIEYLPSLLTPRPIQYHSLFISYAQQDLAIAERLHTDFRKHDTPCWFAPHELVPGDYYRHKIDEAIHTHDKLVLILSQHSIKSDWVQDEVERALKKEESMDMRQQVLFPIRLDDTVMTTSRRWISSLRYHRHIGDFTGWQDDVTYQDAFSTLLRHLKK